MTIEAQRATRNQNLRRALVSSVVARLAGVLLQVVSLPIAAKALGPEGFSIYAMIGAIMAWMTLSNLGISQATTLHMARELGDVRNDRSVAILSASWLIVIAVSFFVVLIVIGLILFTPLVNTVFERYTADVAPIQEALLFACFVFLTSQNLWIFEAAQLAHQRQDRYNIAAALGTTVAAVAVYWTAHHDATVLTILVAVHLPVIVLRAVNAGMVWRQIGPGLADLLAVTRTDVRRMVQDGVSFVSGTSVSNFLCHPFSILAVGVYAGTMMTASFAAVMSAVLIASAVFGYVMTPFRGALPEASRRGDMNWIRRMYTMTLMANLGYALIPCLLFAVFGEWLFAAWYQGTVAPERGLLIAAGLYMLCLALEVTNYNFLASLGKVQSASRWMLGKSVVSALVVWSVAATGRADMAIWGLVVTNVVLSLCPLGLMTAQLLQVRAEIQHV